MDWGYVDTLVIYDHAIWLEFNEKGMDLVCCLDSR